MGTGSTARVSYEAGDFFARQSPTEQFALAYDVTWVTSWLVELNLRLILLFFRFFVAVPPALRAEWGRQMNMQVAPGGLLITLIWPIHPTRDIGPPYGVDPELTAYSKVLGKDWEKVYERDVTETMGPGPVEGSTAKIVVWQKLLD